MSATAKERILHYINRHPEGVSPGELAKKLRIASRTVSAAIGELIADGLIDRPSEKGKVYPAGTGQPKDHRSRSAGRESTHQDSLSSKAAGSVVAGIVVIGLAFKLGILRPWKIAQHQSETLAWLFKAGGTSRNWAERFIASAQIIVLGRHASEDPEERQRQVALAELAAAERELKRRVQWRDNLAACVLASPGPRMVSGLEGLKIIRPLPMPEPVPGVPVMPLEPGRQLFGRIQGMSANTVVSNGVEPPTQLWEPGQNFSFDYPPLRGFAPGCVIYRQQLAEVASRHLQQAQEGVDAMTSPPPALPSSPITSAEYVVYPDGEVEPTRS